MKLQTIFNANLFINSKRHKFYAEEHTKPKDDTCVQKRYGCHQMDYSLTEFMKNYQVDLLSPLLMCNFVVLGNVEATFYARFINY